jgi:hypothetical protein
MQEQWVTPVPCDDFANRPRHAAVVITDDARVSVVAPPGGSAVWHPSDVRDLQAALTEAVVEAVRRKGGAR